MKKKSLSILMAMMIFSASVVPMENGILNIAKETVYAAEENSLENWTFEDIDNSTVKAVSYTGSEEEVTIPEVVNGKTVTVIGKETFFRSGVKSVIIPDTVTTIEDYAFSLSDIESVTISKNVTQIGEYAFSECFKLAEFIVSANSEHYTSENGILYNKDKTFLLFVTNSYENEFTIPETVVNVKKGAFKNCEKITSINIHKDLENVDVEALNISTLRSIVVAEENETYSSVDGVLFNEDKTCLVKCPKAYLETEETLPAVSYIIPNGVTKVGDYAFFDSQLEEVTLSTDLIEIGKYAFAESLSLKTMQFPQGIESIGDYAFSGCMSLNGIEIPEGITSINDGLFSGCWKLDNISLQEGITSIGDYAFKGCSELTEIVLPSTVTSIGASAFEDCWELNTINIPREVTEIGRAAFSHCGKLESIELPSGLTRIEPYTFTNCVLLGNVTIPDDVTIIGECAFDSCIKFTRIEIPKGLTTIEKAAFGSCDELEYIYIPNSVTTIHKDAFGYDDKLTIYSNHDAYAHEYADKNNIKWQCTSTPLTETEISISESTYKYDGETKEPEVSVMYGEKVLEEGVDYTFTYTNNVNAGTASVIIKGKEYYCGTVTKTFTITPLNITSAVVESKTYVYDGKAKSSVITVMCGDVELEEGVDYKVVYSNNVNPGKAKVAITGKGNYTGTKTIANAFVIKPAKVTTLKQKTSYDTKSISMTWKKSIGVTGYEVYRATSKNGKYTKIASTSSATYKNSKLKAGTKYYYKVRAYKTVNKEKIYGNYSSVITMSTKTAAPSINVTAGKKQAKITWKKVAGATGYEVYMSTSKNGSYKKIKTATSKSTSYSKTKLTKGKKYFFKVKAYSKINGKKVYSNWSAVKNVKVK